MVNLKGFWQANIERIIDFLLKVEEDLFLFEAIFQKFIMKGMGKEFVEYLIPFIM